MSRQLLSEQEPVGLLIGAALGARLYPLVREVREAVVHGMSATEQGRFRRMLRQVMANMERFESAASAAHHEGSLP